MYELNEENQIEKIGVIALEILPDNITYDEETDSFMVAGYTNLMEHIY